MTKVGRTLGGLAVLALLATGCTFPAVTPAPTPTPGMPTEIGGVTVSSEIGPVVDREPLPDPGVTPNGFVQAPDGDGLSGYLDQELNWQSCASELQCATIKVPLDYADPGAQAITMGAGLPLDLPDMTANHPDVALLSVATRPDCLPDETVSLLAGLNRRKPVWVELGLQTVHEDTARFIRRGYGFPVFEDACRRLKAAGITVVVHVILGLPGEDRERMLETITRMADFSRAGLIDGIKLQLLHVLKGTDLADYYQNHPFPIFSMEEYIDFVIDCAELLPPELVIHRLTGDGPKSLLIAPSWSGNKRLVLNTLARRFKERNTWQGRLSG